MLLEQERLQNRDKDLLALRHGKEKAKEEKKKRKRENTLNFFFFRPNVSFGVYLLPWSRKNHGL
jgi:hypothetical protein